MDTEKRMLYRYYLLERLPMPGAFPNKKDNPPIEIVAFNERIEILFFTENDGVKMGYSWGCVSYEKPLSAKEIEDYELLAEEL